MSTELIDIIAMASLRLFLAVGVSALAWIGMGAAAEGPAPAPIVVKNQGFLPFADAPINYRSEDLSDPIAQLLLQPLHGVAQLLRRQSWGAAQCQRAVERIHARSIGPWWQPRRAS